MLFKSIQAALFASVACALTIPAPSFSILASRAAGGTAASQILEIAPTSGSCNGAPFPPEFPTNDQAAPFLISAMTNTGTPSPPETAASLSLTQYESADLKYTIHPSPGLFAVREREICK